MTKPKIQFASISINAIDEDGSNVMYSLNKNIRTLSEVREFLDKVEQKLQGEDKLDPNDIPF